MQYLLTVLALSFTLIAVAKADDPTSDGRSLFQRVSQAYQNVYAGRDFYYYTREDRIQVLRELIHKIDSEYALLEIKARRIQLDFAKISADALAAEAQIANVDTPLAQAESNLAFIDRVTRFVALFQDTHFSAHASQSPTAISMGFELTDIGGKIVVSALARRLLAYDARLASRAEYLARSSELPVIEIGDEIVSIDGVAAQDAAKALEPYISASSEMFRHEQAVAALGIRGFKYPRNGMSVVVIRKVDAAGKSTNKTVRLPWFYWDRSRRDANLFFASRNFILSSELRLDWDSATNAWKAASSGWEHRNWQLMVANLIGLKEYKALSSVLADDPPVIRTGYLLRDGKAVGFLQVNTFAASLMTGADGASIIDFLSPIKSFVKTLEAQGLPLILDLRKNPGGNGGMPAALVAILTEKDKTYIGPSIAFRVTRIARQFAESWSDGSVPPGLVRGITENQAAELFIDAIAKNQVETSSFSEGDITADEEVGGYSRKIVALVSPSCVSACDITSYLLKSNRRATILGQPSNGTGAGFWSFVPESWRDSYGVVSARVPNFLFGLPFSEAGIAILPDSVDALNTENRPTQPDVAYTPTMADLQENSKDWIDAAFAQLYPPAAAPAAAAQ